MPAIKNADGTKSNIQKAFADTLNTLKRHSSLMRVKTFSTETILSWKKMLSDYDRY